MRYPLGICLAIFAASISGIAYGHTPGPETLTDHVDEDSVTLTPAQQTRFEQTTADLTAPDVRAAAGITVGEDAGQVGKWGPVVEWPVVGIHAALLPNGKVLAYDSNIDPLSSDETYTRATVWNPKTGEQTPATAMTGVNIFCSGLAHMADGALFLAGGNKNPQNEGIAATHIFDGATNAWTRTNEMAYERWYPSVTPLQNGEMLITEGGPDIPEVREPDGDLRVLGSAAMDLPLYPWIDVAPDGRAFVSGPDMAMMSLNPSGQGSWRSDGRRDLEYRSYGSHALYDKGKILVAGGGNSSATAMVIDLNGATPQATPTASMANGRRQHNLTVLADGTVLATGGNSSGASLVDLAHGVYSAELWNPATGQWRTLAAEQVTRQYHSTALLLPDGRVLSSGGGVCTTCREVGYLAQNAQVFSPPYLFEHDGSGNLAPRPVIDSAPGVVRYGESFDVGTTGPSSIGKVALVRLGAVTHSVNMEQRYLPLSFTAGNGAVTAIGPNNANVAPPGVYMLFVIDTDGVPSEAKMVRVTTAPATPSITDTDPDPPANDNNPEVKGTAAAGTTVRIYSTSDCSGSPLGNGTAAQFSSPGITVTVGGDQTTNLRATATDAAGNTSACSTAFPYTEDSTAPAAPAITDTDPDPPANDNNPEVKGTAAAGSTVKIYSTSDCSGSPLATGTAAQFASPGITVTVGGDQTTNLRATATDAAGNTSACSTAFPYVEDSSGPSAPTINSGPSGPTNDSTPTFGFSADAGTTTHCSVDQGTADFVACSSQHTPAALADGSYTFRVRATDAAGNQATATRNFSVDTLAPNAAINSGPSGPTNDSTPTFGFSADAGTTTHCSVDQGTADFVACSSQHTPAALADGSYTFRVRATDAAGNQATATRNFSVDTQAPDTTINSGPSEGASIQSLTPTFSFASTEAGSTFQCSVDGSSFAGCSSPKTLAALAVGSHVFRVRAIDRVGNIDASPGTRSFIVDNIAPQTTITTGPSEGAAIRSLTPTFSFTSSEPGSTFQCRVDGGSFAACSSPKTLATLSQGTHTFRVRAVDRAGNTDATPATRTFSVDSQPPDTTITAGPGNGGSTQDPTPTFSFTSSEPGSTFQCRVDGGSFAACSSPKTLATLSQGTHTFRVRAVDRAGNTDATPATRSFKVG